MTDEFDDYYQLLGVKSDATIEEIKRARRKKLASGHADKNPGSEEAVEFMRQLNAAAEVLLEPMKREAYDRKWKRHHASKPPRHRPKPSRRPRSGTRNGSRQPQTATPPGSPSRGTTSNPSFWVGLGFAVAAVGVAYAAANRNTYDRNAERYRDRNGRFRSGRFS